MTPAGAYLSRPAAGLATTIPGAAEALRAAGVRFAAAGGASLATAAGAGAARLAAEIGALRDAALADAPQDTPDLIDHILIRYHLRHKAELPALVAAARDAEREDVGAPAGLAALLDGLRACLAEHMLREEMRLFPLLRRGDVEAARPALEVLRGEHEDNAEFLLRLETLTDGYRAPSAALGSLYGALERLSGELVAHVFLEEQALFPRFEAGRA